MRSVQSKQHLQQHDLNDVIPKSLLLTLNIFHTCSIVFLLLTLNRYMFAGYHVPN